MMHAASCCMHHAAPITLHASWQNTTWQHTSCCITLHTSWQNTSCCTHHAACTHIDMLHTSCCMHIHTHTSWHGWTHTHRHAACTHTDSNCAQKVLRKGRERDKARERERETQTKDKVGQCSGACRHRGIRTLILAPVGTAKRMYIFPCTQHETAHAHAYIS